MWVLSPMPPAASQRALEEGGSIPNAVQFLTSGTITIGRPAKKGGTTGKADMLIFGESSVSTEHAVLDVQKSDAEGPPGAVTITDVNSKFGTFISHGCSQERRLAANEPHQLQEHDTIRFGTKCRYQLHNIQLTIYANRHHINLQHDRAPRFPPATIAADVDWQQATTFARSIGAKVAMRFDAEGAQPGLSHTEDSYCVAAEGGELTSTALAALALKVPVVTVGWLATVAAKKAHAESLPDPAGFAVQQLLLPGVLAAKVVDISMWKRPGDDLLTSYVLVFHEGHDENLVIAARASGAEVQIGLPDDMDLADQAAAGRGKAVVAVLSHAAAEELGSGVEHTQPQIPEDELLYIIAFGDITSLSQMVAEHRQKQEAASAAAATAQQEAEAAKAAALVQANSATAAAAAALAPHVASVAANVLAAAASDTADETDEGTDEGEADGASSEPLKALQPVLHRRGIKKPAGSGPSPAAKKQKTPTKRKTPAQQKTPAKQATKSPLQLNPSTPGRSRNSKRGAAAARVEAAPVAAAGGTKAALPAGRRRRKLADTVAATRQGDDDAVVVPAPSAAAAASAGAAAIEAQQQQQFCRTATAQPVAGPVAAAALGAVGGGTSVVNGRASVVNTAELTQLKEGIFAAALVIPTPQQQQQENALPNSSSSTGVNFKAFRRKQQPQGVQLAPRQPAAGGAAAGFSISLVPESKDPTGPDTDAFLREERQRMERLKKADELFNATIKPIAKPAARGRAKH